MLQQIFSQLLQPFHPSQDRINQLWSEIEKAYSHKKRHYHNLTHLENMYQQLMEVESSIQDLQSVLFALFYHDIVYNILNTDNEERSADIAIARMKSLAIPSPIIEHARKLILATKKHQLSEDIDSKIFLDADLSVLGASSEEYKLYAKAVRREYNIYLNFIYNPGRKKVLKSLMENDRIFKTAYFIAKFEEKARENISWELKRLSG